MMTVSQVNPIWAYFNPSESTLPRSLPQGTGNYFWQGQPGFSVLAPRSNSFRQTTSLIRKRADSFTSTARLAARTGTIQMAAEFPNPGAALRPGGFGRVRIQSGVNHNALLIPQPAVIEVQSNYMVLVLGSDNKAVFRPVKMGERVGPNWIISEGLKPGERGRG